MRLQTQLQGNGRGTKQNITGRGSILFKTSRVDGETSDTASRIEGEALTRASRIEEDILEASRIERET